MKTLPKHGLETFVLVDPVQDYEETLTILGVYSTLAAAKRALPAHRRRPYSDGGIYTPYNMERTSEVQHWRGGTIIETWTFDPEKGWHYDGLARGRQ